MQKRGQGFVKRCSHGNNHHICTIHHINFWTIHHIKFCTIHHIKFCTIHHIKFCTIHHIICYASMGIHSIHYTPYLYYWNSKALCILLFTMGIVTHYANSLYKSINYSFAECWNIKGFFETYVNPGRNIPWNI